MQEYRVQEESIIYQAGDSSCELIFFRCTEPHKNYHLYDLDLVVDGYTYWQLYEQSIGESQGTFKISSLNRIIKETVKVLDEWCLRHPHTFISFFDGISYLWKVYYKIGFASDGRGDTFVAFVNSEGKRTAYTGMLNLLEPDDFWVNDIWRVAKDYNYYLGDFYSPVDLLADLFTQAGIPHIKTSYKKPSFFDET